MKFPCRVFRDFALCLFSLLLASPSLTYGQARYEAEDAFEDLQFTNPVGIITAPNDSRRVFVLERRGVISVITNVAIPNRNVFMDISAQVTVGTGTGDERGLLGMAIHPGYETNRYFYLFYTTGGLLDRVSRFEFSPVDPNRGLPFTEQVLIDQPDQASNHNGGDLHFGPDGYLYISLGDEGGANDQYDNSQRIDKDFFSGILRIDVDKRPGNLQPNAHVAATTNYFVPFDNPFVGQTSFNGLPVTPSAVRTEFWAVGLRNPWRMSFDSVTGFLYVGDVGQNAREEINVIEKGGNYGWDYREGLIGGPGTAPAGFVGIDPIQDYPRSGSTNNGVSVTGGVVYRGNKIPDLYGDYVFADYLSGNFWALNYDGMNVEPYRHLLTYSRISAFGVDPSNGDVLFADLVGGRIKRLVYREPSALLIDVVQAGSVWKYRDIGESQGTVWREPLYDDSAWPEGAAELGAGDGGEVTVIDHGPNGDRHLTTYFRHHFNVPNPGSFASLDLNVLRDDGVVVYLNGTEVFRDNLPEGTILYSTLATVGVSGANETAFFGTSVDPGLLVAGPNLLAAEVHQSSATSSDISFDLRLQGETLPALEIAGLEGAVRLTWPAPTPGFSLLQTEARAPANWVALGAPVEREGAENRVTVNTSGDGRLFRLAKLETLRIRTLPASASVSAGEDVTFTVEATGNGQLEYQWMLDGEEIEGAIEASLELTSVELADAGTYTVRIVDELGLTETVGASLVVLVRPMIVVPPQDVTVTEGENATFFVETTGTLPMGYRWRSGGTTAKNEVTSLLTSTLTLTNVPLSLDGLVITVVLTNAAAVSPGILSPRATLTVLPQAD